MANSVIMFEALGYAEDHPDRAIAEIAHLHETLPKAQAAIAAIDSDFAARLEVRRQLQRFQGFLRHA